MSVAFTVKPLYVGADEPYCSLLTIDDFTVMLDCGWNIHKGEDQLEFLREIVPTINAVVISFSDMEHAGGVPYLIRKLGLTAPVYSTTPVKQMSFFTLYDFLQASNATGSIAFSYDDVDAALSFITDVVFDCEINVKGSYGEGLLLSPSEAGHCLGGAIWSFTKETEVALYAVDFNHAGETHLNPGLAHAPRGAALIITNARNATLPPLPPLRQRETAFVKLVRQTLHCRGNVLIPVSAATRSIELLCLLNNHWAEYQLAFPLVFLSAASDSTLEITRSLVEWSSTSMQSAFSSSRVNPLDLAHVQCVFSLPALAEIQRASPTPVVVLCTAPHLDNSFARELFLEFSQNPNSAIILTERPPVSHSEAFWIPKSDFGVTTTKRPALEGPSTSTPTSGTTTASASASASSTSITSSNPTTINTTDAHTTIAEKQSALANQESPQEHIPLILQLFHMANVNCAALNSLFKPDGAPILDVDSAELGSLIDAAIYTQHTSSSLPLPVHQLSTKEAIKYEAPLTPESGFDIPVKVEYDPAAATDSKSFKDVKSMSRAAVETLLKNKRAETIAFLQKCKATKTVQIVRDRRVLLTAEEIEEYRELQSSKKAKRRRGDRSGLTSSMANLGVQGRDDGDGDGTGSSALDGDGDVPENALDGAGPGIDSDSGSDSGSDSDSGSGESSDNDENDDGDFSDLMVGASASAGTGATDATIDSAEDGASSLVDVNSSDPFRPNGANFRPKRAAAETPEDSAQSSTAPGDAVMVASAKRSRKTPFLSFPWEYSTPKFDNFGQDVDLVSLLKIASLAANRPETSSNTAGFVQVHQLLPDQDVPQAAPVVEAESAVSVTSVRHAWSQASGPGICDWFGPHETVFPDQFNLHLMRVRHTPSVQSTSSGPLLPSGLLGSNPNEAVNSSSSSSSSKAMSRSKSSKKALPSTKMVSSRVSVAVAANVSFVDFEGLSDGPSIRSLFQQLQPRAVVVLNGTSKARAALQNFLLSKDVTGIKDVHVPSRGFLTVIATSSKLLRLTLSEALASQLYFSEITDRNSSKKMGSNGPGPVSANTMLTDMKANMNAKLSDANEQSGQSTGDHDVAEYSIALASARVVVDSSLSDYPILAPASTLLVTAAANATYAQSKAIKTNNGDAGDDEVFQEELLKAIEMLSEFDLIPNSLKAKYDMDDNLMTTKQSQKSTSTNDQMMLPLLSAARPAMFLGQLQLNDLQVALVRNGISVFLNEGVLFCGADGLVMVKKNPTLGFTIDGLLNETMFQVREILYNQFQIV